MDLDVVLENLDRTIEGKTKLRNDLLRQIAVNPVAKVMLDFLDINLDELEAIRKDLQAVKASS